MERAPCSEVNGRTRVIATARTDSTRRPIAHRRERASVHTRREWYRGLLWVRGVVSKGVEAESAFGG
jgi:hypothetical protein